MATLSVAEEKVSRTGKVLALVKLMRPHHWTKNGFCLAGLVFSGRWSEPREILAAVIMFFLFAAASSSVYILNDIADIERDRLHPRKRNRPLPAGEISLGQAMAAAVILAAIGLTFPFIDGRAYGCLLGYFLLNVVYSLWLKHHALIDVAAIALGFVLRLLAGVYAVKELPTTWITLCTFFLALFLALAKRRSELADGEAANGNSQRPVLARYSLSYLDSILNSAATMTIMTYALFTVTSGKNPTLIVTVPFVHIAIMYYKLLIFERRGGEEPERILIRNRPIQLCIFLWLGSYLYITQTNVHLFK